MNAASVDIRMAMDFLEHLAPLLYAVYGFRRDGYLYKIALYQTKAFA